MLFQDTVFNNIRLGNPCASMDEVVAAAKRARCHEFIMQLENGYDTVLGEGGTKLSGGEKQRLSIARAIIKDAPIVLLDEVTANMDVENELMPLRPVMPALAAVSVPGSAQQTTSRFKTVNLSGAATAPTVWRASAAALRKPSSTVKRAWASPGIISGRFKNVKKSGEQAVRSPDFSFYASVLCAFSYARRISSGISSGCKLERRSSFPSWIACS